MNNFSFKSIHKYSEFLKLKDEWECLWEQSNASIFSSFAWYNALLRAFKNAEKRLEFDIILLYTSDHCLRCIAPLKIENNKVKFLSNYQADYQDFIYTSFTDCEMMFKYICSHYNKMIISLDTIPSHSTVLNLSQRNNDIIIKPSENCPVLVFDNYDSEKDIQSKNYRRKKRMLQQLGEISINNFFAANDILPNMVRFKEFYKSRWGEDPESSFFFEPFDDLLLFEIVKSFSVNNKIILSSLTLNGLPIAYYLGFVDRKKYMFYRSGFDNRYEKYSPGMVLLKVLLNDLKKKGYIEFDFLRGEYAYKSMYANSIRYNFCVEVV